MSMASRLWDWWARREDYRKSDSSSGLPAGSAGSGEKAERSGIFTYQTRFGTVRYYDPMTVRGSLNATFPEWAEAVDLIAKVSKPLPPAIQTADPEAETRRRAGAEVMTTQLIAACRTAFDLPPLDNSTGNGFTANECLGVLRNYLGYCAEIMEKTRPLANSPGRTDSPGGN